MSQSRLQIAFPALLCLCATTARSIDADEKQQFFESQVRPLLAEHCQSCHNADDTQGGVRLDLRSGVFSKVGNASVVTPGNPDASRLVAVVKYNDNDIQMPPDGELSEEQQAILAKWVADGAYWPAEKEGEASSGPYPLKADGSIDFEAAAEAHWAYQPIKSPAIPVVEGARIQSPIDAFVAAKLQENGLTQNEPADRATLYRRMSFDLLGLPPAFDQIQQFKADDRETAVDEAIESLLSNPHFGERWARHWLDVARYADTTGYRTADKSTAYPNAYTYRDWVIEAFNKDMPYDEFLIAQIAADRRWPDDPQQQAALGFLTVGPVFIDNGEEQINDQIDVVSRGLMGMTLTCARCHDHKFDPVPTSDYYALYGVFASTRRVDNGTEIPVSYTNDGITEFRNQLAKKTAEYQAKLEDIRQRIQKANREQLADYLVAGCVEAGFIPQEQRPKGEPELRGRSVSRWRDMLRSQRNHPVVSVLWEIANRRNEQDFQNQIKAWAESQIQNPGKFAPAYLELIRQSPPESMEAAARQLAEKMSAGEAPFAELFDLSPAPTSFAAANIRDVSDRDLANEIVAAKKKIDDHWANHPHAPPRAMTVAEGNPHDVQIFVRGNSGRRGDVAPRRFPHVLSAASAERFTNGSGREELANAIVDPANPLTARVIVNRIWTHYFGRGLVITPSDFGTQGEKPSHPELLDYLASQLIAHDWSLKWLHREILRSATYQQSSADKPKCREVDPENVLLWRQNRKRLEFEPMRDSMLAVAGLLSEQIGGKAVALDNLSRRTIYLKVDRNNPPELLRTFDVPDTEQSNPARSETTVPQQALFLMNNGATQKIAEGIVGRLGEGSEAEKVTKLFHICLAREPSGAELEAVSSLFHDDPVAAAKVLVMSNEFLFVD